jgi:FG-GAP-like repeat/Kelch motif/Galactose oxidase, central domain
MKWQLWTLSASKLAARPPFFACSFTSLVRDAIGLLAFLSMKTPCRGRMTNQSSGRFHFFSWSAVSSGFTSAAMVLAAIFCFAALSPAAQADSWKNTGSMAIARGIHTATLLQNGKVLVAGGKNAGASTATAELYDPATGTWSATGSMAVARSNHTATLLPNGKVLVAGGVNTGPPAVSGAELYDPATGTWSATSAMNLPRENHTATLFPDGKVLVVGGISATTIYASWELYDPATGSWVLGNDAHVGTHSLAVAGLIQLFQDPYPYVLVVGGLSNLTPMAYGKDGSGFSQGAGLTTGRCSHSGALLQNGKFLVVGGNGDIQAPLILGSAEFYDPALQYWSSAGSMAQPRENFTATTLTNGKVLAAGGNAVAFAGLNSAELYDPATPTTWTAAAPMNNGRYSHTATLLSNGTVLVTGGFVDNSGGTTASAEIYQPVSTAAKTSTHDFNGDGVSDVLWRDTSGNVAILEMNGTTILNQATSFVAQVPTAWSIAGSGDFNGDGKSDILWHDTNGNVSILEMNGTSILNQATSFVGQVSTVWSIQNPQGN